jgi:hypothetical protein
MQVHKHAGSGIIATMSNTEIITERDERSGRFVTGNTGGGRPKGARNKLGEQFVQDLALAWQEHGIEALDRVAKDDPAAFLRVVAGLMPKDVNLNLSLNAAEFADRWRQAAELLGHDVTMSTPRRPLRVVSPALPGSARTATKTIEP